MLANYKVLSQPTALAQPAVTVEVFAHFRHSGEPEEENAVASYTADNLLYRKRPQTAPQKHFKVRICQVGYSRVTKK